VPRTDTPYPVPERGAPIRLAFVGQRTYFEQHTLETQQPGLIPRFFDLRSGDDPTATIDGLLAFAPHAVVCFRPDGLPSGALAEVRAPVLGILTEPLPGPGVEPHESLEYNLAELRRVDPGNLDRAIVVDARAWETAAELVPMWRCAPLPVSDRFYRAPRPAHHPPQIIYVGHATTHREESLLDLKHQYDIRHYAHALMGDDLATTLASADVAIVLHNDRWIHTFHSTVLLHLAAGLLVLTERLAPSYRLESGLELLEVRDRHELGARVHQLHQAPNAYDRVRWRGHHFSRQYAASKVWPRLIGDLFTDIATFGTARI
jgi:hypothetical protein